MVSHWHCATHGQVMPFHAFTRTTDAELDHLAHSCEVPVWLPDPVPPGWELSGLGWVSDSANRGRASVTVFRGPAPLGGTGEWMFVAEEPAVGLGAGFAGVPDANWSSTTQAASAAHVHAFNRPAPLWVLDTAPEDRSVYLGEAGGVWLWLIGIPADAGYAVLDDLILADVRTGDADLVSLPRAERPDLPRPR